MRLVSEGHVDCLFYARDTATLDGLAAEVKQSFPEYRIEQGLLRLTPDGPSISSI